MRALKIAASLLLLAAIPVGCNEQDAPTALGQAPAMSGPQFNFSNGPVQPGQSGIIRESLELRVATSDFDPQLVARHYAPEEHPACSGFGGEVWDWSWVGRDDLEHAIKIVAQLKDAVIYIYPFWDGVTPFCTWLQEHWLYQGTHSLTWVDNDFDMAAPGANSYGWNGHGRVEDPDGNTYRYHESQRFQITTHGEFRIIKEVIEVKAIGK